MRTLQYLQEGVLTEDKGVVNSYVEGLDLRTSNEEMVKAGEKFGFKTINIFGKEYGLMSEIAGKMGYMDPSSYGKLLRKWEIYTPNVGTFGSDCRMTMVEKLGIEEKDGRSLLVDWTGFLICGVKGEGENADEVLAYLLRRDREARISGVLLDDAKAEELRMKLEKHSIDMTDKRLSVMQRKLAILEKTKQSTPEQLKAEYRELLSVEFPKDPQHDFDFGGKHGRV